MPGDPATERLRAENEDLRARLEEAEATLDAIRKGEVDAVVVAGADGHRVYTLEGADQFYRVLIEAMQPGQGAASLSADGTILYCNRSFAALLGVPTEKAGGRSFAQFVSPPDAAAWQHILQAASGAQSQGELRLQPRGGPPVPVHLALNALPLSGAVALGLVVTDLTERRRQEVTARRLVEEEAARAAAEQVARQARQAEAAVRQSEARFRHLADALPQVVWMARPDGRLDYFNRRWYDYTGNNAGAGGDDGLVPVLHPDDVQPCLDRWGAAVRSGDVYETECRLREGRSGVYRWFLVRAVPVGDDAGRVVRWFGTCTDIDVSKKVGERLRLLWEAAAVLLSTEQPDAMMRELFARIAPHLGLDAYFNFMVEEAGDALRMESCVGIPADEARKIARLDFGQAICGTVALRRQPITATHIQGSDDPKAQLVKGYGIRVYACNPLMAGDRLLGTLSFASRTRDAFDADELEFLRTVCHYVAYAYERLRLIRRLREEDRKKDDFLATLAHELRNPLAPIRNAAQYLRLKGPPDPGLRNARDIIDRQLGQMTRLVDDLLDISRITRGKVVLRRERVEVGLVLTNAVEASRPAIEAGRHDLAVAVPPGPLLVDGDAARLTQVFGNLLTNAAKYTDRGGRIRVAAERQGSDVVVSVADTGIGIAAEHLPGLFDMFSQVAPALERSQGGLGIGLALVRSLVEMHGGRVEARSDGPGRGSEFLVRLPLRIGAPPPAPAPPGGGRAPGTTRGRRVVVADDNVDGAESLAMMLSVTGHEVRVVHDGQAAVALAEEFRPDVILLDIGMPRLNGYEAARAIRGREWGKEVVLAALTGWGQDEDRRRAEEAGFDRHFTKPVDPAALEQLLGGVRAPAT